MKRPMLALEKVASITGRQLILETHVDLMTLSRPAFYPAAELEGDASNWWGQTESAMTFALVSVEESRHNREAQKYRADCRTRESGLVW